MGDHILRPMGAAILRIEPDTQPGRLIASITDEQDHCLTRHSVTSDVAGALAMEAMGQHYLSARSGELWLCHRANQLSRAT